LDTLLIGAFLSLSLLLDTLLIGAFLSLSLLLHALLIRAFLNLITPIVVNSGFCGRRGLRTFRRRILTFAVSIALTLRCRFAGRRYHKQSGQDRCRSDLFQII
jgi:hypothetical protein